MNAIIGFSDLALTSTLYEPGGCVQNVQRAGRNLLSIINDIWIVRRSKREAHHRQYPL